MDNTVYVAQQIVPVNIKRSPIKLCVDRASVSLAPNEMKIMPTNEIMTPYNILRFMRARKRKVDYQLSCISLICA